MPWILVLKPNACHVRLHCIDYLDISCFCFAFCLWNHIFYIPIFSLVVLRKFMQVLYGDDKESTSLLFCLGNSKPLFLKTGLILPHMLGLDIVSFSHSMSLLFFCFIFFST
jgi:hypothetical protein